MAAQEDADASSKLNPLVISTWPHVEVMRRNARIIAARLQGPRGFREFYSCVPAPPPTPLDNRRALLLSWVRHVRSVTHQPLIHRAGHLIPARCVHMRRRVVVCSRCAGRHRREGRGRTAGHPARVHTAGGGPCICAGTARADAGYVHARTRPRRGNHSRTVKGQARACTLPVLHKLSP